MVAASVAPALAGCTGSRARRRTLTSKYLTTDQRFVSFDIQVTNDSTGTSWGTTAYLVADPGAWRSEGAGADDRVIDVSMDFGAQQVTLTDSLGEATTSPLTLAPRS